MSARHNFDFLSNGGEMGALMRAHDWTATILGAPGGWPDSLKTAVRIVLTSNHPMFIWWGPDLIQFYNDAYRQTMGPERHPSALGQHGRDCWDEIWHIIGPQIETVMAGGPSTWHVDQLVPVTRHGRREDVWWTYGYSPIEDGEGVRGVLVVCNDVTREHESKDELKRLNAQLVEQVSQRKHAERDLAFQLKVVDHLRTLTDADEIANTAFAMLSAHMRVSRINYAEILDEASFRIVNAWQAEGMPSIAGLCGPLDAYGPEAIAELRGGQTVIVRDVQTDPRTAAFADAHMAVGARAFLVVPVMADGRFAATLTLHQSEPYDWSAEHVILVADVATRVFNAIEHARSKDRRDVAEQALLRERIADSERLGSLFRQAPGFMAILRGPGHMFEFVNSAHQQIVGERELIGKRLREAIPEIVEQGFEALLDQVYCSGQPFMASDVRVRVQRHADGPATELYLDFVYQPILDATGAVTGVFVAGVDATERHVWKAALESSDERLKEGMVAARMAVWHWDLASGAISCDNSEPVFGCIVTSVDDFRRNVHPDDLGTLDARVTDVIASGGTCETIARFVRPDDGSVVWLQSRGRVICDADGKSAAIRGISIDITERKKAEEALREADRRKDEFLAMLAHELRNPLAPVRAAAHLLQLVPHDVERVRHASEIISRQVDHMTSLVNDLLDVSRVTTGLVTLERERLDLRQVVTESTEQVRPLMEAAGHRLSLHMPPVPAPVSGDHKRLVQVLTNLLQNAAKYTPPSGQITLRLALDGMDAVISVTDNGAGIDPGLLPHVFDLFTQEKRTSDRSQGGLGLGLALVRSLVNLHAGRVEASSGGSGQGATFTVFLPLMEAQTQAAPAFAQPLQPRAQGRALRLLVVDDNVDAARVLAMSLEAAGHEVVVEHKAQAALERIKQGAHDAFLLDIGLPGMDGNELARQVRQLPQAAGARLIAISGYGQEGDRQKSIKAGFDDYLVKPADPAALLELLAQVGAEGARSEAVGRAEAR